MIRYIILLQIDMYLVQMIQVKITYNIVMILRKKPPLEKMSLMNISVISQEHEETMVQSTISTP